SRSTGPKRASTSVARSSRSPPSERSTVYVSTSAPASRAASATLRRPGSSRSIRASRACRAARSSARAAPMPLAAPVTTQTLPATQTRRTGRLLDRVETHGPVRHPAEPRRGEIQKIVLAYVPGFRRALLRQHGGGPLDVAGGQVDGRAGG